ANGWVSFSIDGRFCYPSSGDVIDTGTKKVIAKIPAPGKAGNEKVLEIQERFTPPGGSCRNVLQTNGVLLDDRWGEFLKAREFLVGVSLDGPPPLHDLHRVDHAGRPTSERALRGLHILQRHGVPFNVLTTVHRGNGSHPREVYRFFRGLGVEFMQFIPIVERLEGVPLGGVPDRPPEELVSPRSVLPEQWGAFLNGVFDDWILRDVGRIFVQSFDQALAGFLGLEPALCVFRKHCGWGLALEHNGDLYSCDHFVEPGYRLGNIHEQPIRELAALPRQIAFGRAKEETLPGCCRNCRWLSSCNGGCPKNRFLAAPEGEGGLNVLCGGYRAFFGHAEPVMRAMAAEIRAGGTAASVMKRLTTTGRPEAARAAARAGENAVPRNAPCPCGSGRKLKCCCGKRAVRGG
ncbi:MAG: SPASM domain-containing protein, partial [Planctomycetota bacterium]